MHLQGSTSRSRWGKGEEIKRQATLSLCAERELTNERKERDMGERVGDRKD